MATSLSPTTPTESTTGVPVGGFSKWFRDIGDWLKLLSPSGASQYETDWVDITLASGFQVYGEKPQVQRIGKEIFFRGGIQQTMGTFSTTAIITIGTVPNGFTPGYWMRAQSVLSVAGNSGLVCSGNVSPDGTIQIRLASGVANSVALKGLSGYTVA